MPSTSTTASKYAGKDFYKILKVSHTATAKEIKLAYYKLALTLHPDKHQGCSIKDAEFKKVNEAYDVLSHSSRRGEYDFATGHRYNNNRKMPPPTDYRKVYTVRPPPHWKTVWDHAEHYEMHYGDGFQNMATKQIRKQMERDGELDFEYRSPLGRGFYFSNEPLEGLNGDTPHRHTQNNPFSKRAHQGPPKRGVTIEYSEGSLHANTGRQTITRREKIVEELHTVRRERHQSNPQQPQQQRSDSPLRRATQQSSSSSPFARYSTQATATRYSQVHPVQQQHKQQKQQQNEKPQPDQEKQSDVGCVIS